jgi:hypothetical protein
MDSNHQGLRMTATWRAAKETTSVMTTDEAVTKASGRTRLVGRVEHFTTAERAARGKARRAEVPRRVHGEWAAASQRPDPVGLLEEQAKTGSPHELVVKGRSMWMPPAQR